jgi:hypothetical protein
MLKVGCAREVEMNRESMRTTGAAAATALALLLTIPGVGAADSGQPRLKYRGSGLACTCASGTSEADIRKAWDARMKQSEGDRLDRLDGSPITRDEQRRREYEAQPR